MRFYLRRQPLVRGKSSGEKFLRLVLLIAVFSGVAYAFWLNTERTMQRLATRGTVYDQTETMQKAEKKALRDFAGLFKDEFGLQLKFYVVTEAVSLPELDGKTIFMGVNPATGQVLVDFPPLVRKALGDELMYRLQNEFIPARLESHGTARSLLDATALVWNKLLGEPESSDTIGSPRE